MEQCVRVISQCVVMDVSFPAQSFVSPKRDPVQQHLVLVKRGSFVRRLCQDYVEVIAFRGRFRCVILRVERFVTATIVPTELRFVQKVICCAKINVTHLCWMCAIMKMVQFVKQTRFAQMVG